VLGLKPGATVTDIKDTFRQLAKRRHPDFGGTNAAMREVIEAYDAAIAEVTKEH
jgi:DnaJ-class molecular chaperone